MSEAARAAALQAVFERVWREQMLGLPMVNPALRVEAVGFRPWDDRLLGVLVTPWFMNLVLLPRAATGANAAGARATRAHRFPAGLFEFIGAFDAAIGAYESCSLFSPMFEFADQEGARATALAALDELLGAVAAPVLAIKPAAPAVAPGLSKRDFLFGRRGDGARG
ncbi:MAG: [NiFe]-hydrogenase assembly chaperone HybE [Burkholderiales bacterium]|nr:[NiFe]-hydrogenase assembly chaperone HybE [Burkholderiales bacterium]MDE2158447.1 [NiFe]-hydrogenase assembly chaperone HybE [Burkholderiales bacterium]